MGADPSPCSLQVEKNAPGPRSLFCDLGISVGAAVFWHPWNVEARKLCGLKKLPSQRKPGITVEDRTQLSIHRAHSFPPGERTSSQIHHPVLLLTFQGRGGMRWWSPSLSIKQHVGGEELRQPDIYLKY